MLVTNVSSNNLTVIRGFDGTGTGATNSDGTSNVNTLGSTAAKSHVDGSVVRLATGNANSTDDFSGWGDAASGGLTTTTRYGCGLTITLVKTCFSILVMIKFIIGIEQTI